MMRSVDTLRMVSISAKEYWHAVGQTIMSYDLLGRATVLNNKALLRVHRIGPPYRQAKITSFNQRCRSHCYHALCVVPDISTDMTIFLSHCVCFSCAGFFGKLCDLLLYWLKY